MKKIVLAALLALFAAVPGMAASTALPVEQMMENPEIDPQLVHDILKAAAQESSYSFGELWDGYYSGTVTIDKVPNGYRVVDPGNQAIIMVEDSF